MIYALAQILLTTGNAEGYVSGMIITILALFMIVYALFLYFKRLRLLQSRSHTGYVERLGPLTLGLALIVAVGISLSYTVAPPKAAPVTPPIVEESGVCIKHGIDGVSAMAYQPSDILSDNKGNDATATTATAQLLLVPSLTDITALPLILTSEGKVNDTAASSASVEVLLTVNGENFEGLTYVNDTLYAVSEDNKGSGKLFALQWDTTNTLSVIDSWKIESPGPEGLAYIPNPDGSLGRLLIAADLMVEDPLINKDKRGEIHVYEVPTSNNDDDGGSSTLSPLFKINTDLIGYGLTDSKISALQYFENVLYALHENSNVLRGWDLDSATIAAEWNVPNVTGGFSNQWEGFYFERTGDVMTSAAATSGGSLRGLQSSASSQLLLHMALDTPPQIWTMVAEAGSSSGSDPQSIIMPKCSGMEQKVVISPSL